MKGRIRSEDIDEVRRRANIVDIASEYMQVRKAGSARFKALCPFHQEKTPSLSIDVGKGMYHCFGCQKGGDVFNLVMELESLDFPEAVERLAAKTGVQLTYEQVSPAQREAFGKKQRLIAAHREAVAFYHERLMASHEAKAAREYIKKRGLTKETVEAFSLGWAPGPPKWDELCRHLLKKRFAEGELLEAGLASKSERGGIIDRFRARIVFPTFDVTGDPVAFGGRVLDDSTPKYLNSAETPIFHKGLMMYGLNWAKRAISVGGRAIVVEGYMDVIALHQAGVSETVATNGTALSADHFRLLGRFAPQIVLALDSDEAGAAAVERAFDAAHESSLDVRMVITPHGKDPADFVTSQGGDAFRVLAAEARPLVDFWMQSVMKPFDLTDSSGRERAVRAVLPILAKVRDEVTRNLYTRRLADMTGAISKEDQAAVFLQVGRALGNPAARSVPQVRRTSAQVSLERDLLKVALQYPEAIEEFAYAVETELFSVPAHKAIWTEVLTGGDAAKITERLTEEGARESVRTLVMEEVRVALEPDGLPPRSYVADIVVRMKGSALKRLIDQKKRYLQKINPIEYEQEYRKLYSELIALEGERKRLIDATGEAEGL